MMHNLDEARAHVAKLTAGLDPNSRYISDLVAIIDASEDVAALERSLLAGCRGQRHAGVTAFAAMSLKDKLLANLVTPETSLFRFNEGEMEALDEELLPRLRSGDARILVVPCSHGEEAFTMAAYLLKVKVAFSMVAIDVQPSLIQEARTGVLTFGFPSEFLKHPGYVADAVLDRIEFVVGDVFDLPLDKAERFDIVLCRNLVGYFVPDTAAALVRALCDRVRPGGALFLDSFCLTKTPALTTLLTQLGARQLRGRPVFLLPETNV